jgi:hypoxanthine phosphoribosyltransferase
MESESIIIVNNEKFIEFISEEKIQARVKELAEIISEDYKNTVPIFIGVLNGAFIFMSDLLKNISIESEVDFFKLSSYGDSKISSGQVRMIKDLNCNPDGRDIIIVEDIIDTGLSIRYIEEIFQHYNPKSMKVVTLLLKPDSLKYDVKIDYIGFKIPSKFVIGYGLDYQQKFRNLPSIYILANDGVN